MADALFIRRGGDSARPSDVGPRAGIAGRSVRIGFSLLLCLVPPLFVYHAFGEGGSIAWILVYLLLSEALFVRRYLKRRVGDRAAAKSGSRGIGLPWFLGVLLFLGALVVFVALDITPASAFLAWFGLVDQGSGGGTIAYMFTVMFTFFSAVFAGIALFGDPLFAVLGLGAIDLFMWGVIHAEKVLVVGAVVLFLIGVGYLAARRLGRLSGRSTLGIVQISLVAALAALPLSAAVGRNGVIDGLFSLQFDGAVAALFPNFPFLYNVPGYGNTFTSTLLGQRPDLTSRPVFKVTGPPGATIYLRTGVYDTYTGTGWRLSRYEKHRGALAGYFYDYGPRHLPPSSTQTIRVKLLADFYDALPNTLDTIGFQYPGERRPSLSYGSLDSGFVLETPMTRGTVITDVIDTSPRPQTRMGFIENLPGFNGRRGLFGGEGRRVPGWRFGSVHGRTSARENTWTDALPTWLRGASMVPSRYTITRKEAKIDLQTGKLPAQVVKLAKSLARPTEDATIASIRSYLKGHYLYSLSTHAAGPAGDTVDDFLFHSRTGYCVQFATAFVILARLDGIPARYVTGFLVYLPQHSRSTIVTGLSAHAWAEVWDRRKGWTTVEATPPMIAADFSDPQFYSRFNPTGSSATKRELEAVLGNRIPVKGKHEAHGGHTRRVSAGQRRGGSASGRIPVAVGAGVLLALILLVTARRLAPPEKRLKRLLRRMARRSRRRGLPDPSAQGWSSWALALARLHPARQAVAQRAGAVILSRFFAGNLRTERDLRFLTRFYRRVFAQPATRSRVERQAPSRS